MEGYKKIRKYGYQLRDSEVEEAFSTYVDFDKIKDFNHRLFFMYINSKDNKICAIVENVSVVNDPCSLYGAFICGHSEIETSCIYGKIFISDSKISNCDIITQAGYSQFVSITRSHLSDTKIHSWVPDGKELAIAIAINNSSLQKCDVMSNSNKQLVGMINQLDLSQSQITFIDRKTKITPWKYAIKK